MQETWVLSLGQEDPLEKEMATHTSILAWKIPWTEEAGGLQSMSDTTEATHLNGSLVPNNLKNRFVLLNIIFLRIYFYFIKV